MLKLKYFYTVGSFFDTEGSAHYSTDGTDRILGKEGIAGFTLKVDNLFDSEGLGG